MLARLYLKVKVYTNLNSMWFLSKSMSAKWFDAICGRFLLLGIFMRKKYFAFSLIVLDNLKWDCGIKTSEKSSFFHLKNNSVTLGLNFF